MLATGAAWKRDNDGEAKLPPPNERPLKAAARPKPPPPKPPPPKPPPKPPRPPKAEAGLTAVRETMTAHTVVASNIERRDMGNSCWVLMRPFACTQSVAAHGQGVRQISLRLQAFTGRLQRVYSPD